MHELCDIVWDILGQHDWKRRNGALNAFYIMPNTCIKAQLVVSQIDIFWTLEVRRRSIYDTDSEYMSGSLEFSDPQLLDRIAWFAEYLNMENYHARI